MAAHILYKELEILAHSSGTKKKREKYLRHAIYGLKHRTSEKKKT